MENCLLFFLIGILDVAYNFYHWYYTEYGKRNKVNILLLGTGIPLEWKDLGRSFKAVNWNTLQICAGFITPPQLFLAISIMYLKLVFMSAYNRVAFWPTLYKQSS